MTKSKQKRLRIFAGPNGSGKTTLALGLQKNKKISLGIFVNADIIERQYKKNGYIALLGSYRTKAKTKEIRTFIEEKSFSAKALGIKNHAEYFKIRKNRIYYKGDFNSYIASDLAAFIRLNLLKRGVSFSFETVFSHESKLQMMENALAHGYRVYFYFLATDDPDINVNRVKIRVAKNGHPVPKDKIIARYYRSLEQMYPAIKLSNRAFLFDNSGKYAKLVAEITEGKSVETFGRNNRMPHWFVDYVYKKSKSK